MESLNERIQHFKGEIDRWAETILRTPNVDFAVLEQILNLGADELNGLDASRAASFAYLLSQYALSVQHETNRQRAFLGWARKIRPHTLNEDRNRLIGMTMATDYRIERLADVGRRIESMSYAMQLVAKTRA